VRKFPPQQGQHTSLRQPPALHKADKNNQLLAIQPKPDMLHNGSKALETLTPQGFLRLKAY
jgi:hypothetical protein